MDVSIFNDGEDYVFFILYNVFIWFCYYGFVIGV